MKVCMEASIVKVLCVDDNNLLQEALRRWFARIPDMNLVGCVETGSKARDLIATFDPDVVLMDVDLPGTDTFELVSQIVSEYPHIRVVMFSAHCSAEQIDRAIEAGATGYISKDESLATIGLAIHAVSRGEFTLSPTANSFYENP